MRVGVMDGDVAASIARVQAARAGLGPAIDLMVGPRTARSRRRGADRVRTAVEPCRIRWFEEPVGPDDRAGAARVRAATCIPIAAGESEFTRFDFADLIDRGLVDVVQPDVAICGGPSEARRIAALAESHQVELAPHCWGSALSFTAGVSLALASPSARTVEYSLGANPFLHELFDGAPLPVGGGVSSADGAGVGMHTAPRRHRAVLGHRRITMSSIQHVNLLVDDLDSAVAFYRDVIGLRPAPTPDLGFPAQFFDIGGDQQLHVNELDDVHPRRAHFCLRLDDFAVVIERAEFAGVVDDEAWGVPTRLPSGVVQLFVRDPAGNLVELNSPPHEPFRSL